MNKDGNRRVENGRLKLTDFIPYFKNNLGHMLMVVAEKP